MGKALCAIAKNKIMNLRIVPDEGELRNRVKTAGGKWNPSEQVWRLPYQEIVDLGLTERIVD